MRLGFSHDTTRCGGCRACSAACRSHNRLEPGTEWREVYAYPEEAGNPQRHYLSVACNHCREPECARVCPVGAIYRRPDGAVLINPGVCNGCRLCILACPYSAPKFSPSRGKVTKCDLCAEQLDAGLAPVCVAACPTDALQLVDIDAYPDQGETPHVPGFPSISYTDPSVRFVTPHAKRGVRE